MDEDKERVVSVVLLLRCDPAPEWPVYQRPNSLYHFKEREILSLFKSGHVWASIKDVSSKKRQKPLYSMRTMFYHSSYVASSKTISQ